MQNNTYRIDPIRAEGALDPETSETLKEVPGWSADEWKDMPGRILGWRLSLSCGGQTIEKRDFREAADGFNQAQEAGKSWLAVDGADDLSRWIAGSSEVARRMGYDPDFQRQVSKKGF